MKTKIITITCLAIAVFTLVVFDQFRISQPIVFTDGEKKAMRSPASPVGTPEEEIESYRALMKGVERRYGKEGVWNCAAFTHMLDRLERSIAQERAKK